MKTIVGLFDSYSQAESCVRDLERAGYDRDDISIVANDAARTGSSGGTGGTSGESGGTAEGAGTGAMIGGAAGGAAGLIASLAGLAIPGIGPVLAAGPIIATLTGAGIGAVAGGLVGALTTAGVPSEHATHYNEGVRRGGSLVTVAADDEDAATVMDIMNRHHPVDIEQRAAQWRQAGYASGATAGGTTTDLIGTTTHVGGETTRVGGETAVPAASLHSTSGASMTTTTSGGMAAGTGAGTGTGMGVGMGAGTAQHLEGEQHIPVVEEELRVGKREVEGGGVRVQTRVEETPVEEQVNLREEHVSVERRPVDRPATTSDFNQAFQGGTLEVTEHAEQAVVQKEARVVEEVVVGKEATERTETVRDTVRRTNVDIQPVELGTGAAASTEFDQYDADFRTNFQSINPGSEYNYDHAKPAYRFGYDLASNRQQSGGEWTSVESDARRRWEDRNPGTWDKFKDATRYAYDRARSKLNT